MRRCIVVCRHPESNQAAWELLQGMADDPGFSSVTVYGVQNTTPNKARTLSSAKFRMLEPADKNRLEVDQLQHELEAQRYDVLLVMHSVGVVASIVGALKGLILGKADLHVALYCEVTREMCLPRHFEVITELARSLKDRLAVASSALGRAEFARLGLQCVRVMAPCLSGLRNLPEIPRAVVDHTRTSLGTRDSFTVLALGRADTSVFMFAEFMARARCVQAKLVLPIENGSKDAVTHLYQQEMHARCPELTDPTRHLMLMSDMAHLTLEDMRTLISACDVVVHTNPNVDYNIPAKVAAGLPVVQIVPNREVHTAHLDTKRTATVPCAFDFYSFDDYGGKISLATPADFAAALLAVHKTGARPVAGAMGPAFFAETEYACWKRFLSFKKERPAATSTAVEPVYAEQLAELRKQLQQLMTMLLPAGSC